MHIKYVINQHLCDKIKNYFHVDHQINNFLIFSIYKNLFMAFLLFVTRSKNCLLYLDGTLKGHGHVHYNNFEIL
jgi:hypothetical protein